MIELKEMPPERFPAYRDRLVLEYARDKVRAGAWSPEEAPRRSAADVGGLLPDGTETEGHYLLLLWDDLAGQEVGVVWIAILDSGVGRSAWIYDIEVYEGFRRKGYATQALRAVEDRATKLGGDRVGLQVFGHNPGARALYEKVGYEITSVNMVKRLGR
ncbi:GNAT family N-acetyltransferase [Rubrobacter tropicus]|uniref:GNAT family N-acetyltransferase n=1 Tax=Rubrobacter tropicus TaxID=2653851 RepID=A0A6G8Q9I4_9ACTN|nr:GNAT family N-acetyltransferase [Rubrobacter tropicus]QIN83103.1 GNAT family N-acetyltransferase [Rubrobacter tropicus]